MMVSVSGKRGVGKTYMLSKKLYERYQEGFLCISNFSHVYSHIDCSQEDPKVLLDIITELGEFKDRGYELVDLDPRFEHSGVFIAIDEAHLLFSADLVKRYQSEPELQGLIRFMAQARKADIEIWYSTQDPAKVDKNFRRYTEDYIRYVPVIPYYTHKDVLQQRPTTASGYVPPPYYRREIRYPFPLFWEEHHTLDNENPVFNYSMVPGRFGDTMSEKSTLDDRHLVRAGWMDPFPYKLYDSYQLINMLHTEIPSEFENLKGYAYIPHEMKREKFPTFKRWLGMTPNDEKVSKRYMREKIELPDLALSQRSNTNKIKQPIEFLDDLAFYNQVYGSAPASRAGPQREPAAVKPAAHPFFKRQEQIVKKAAEQAHSMPFIDGVTAE